MAFVRITSDVDSLTDQEHRELARLLEKAGFTVTSVEGGGLDLGLELDGPGIGVGHTLTEALQDSRTGAFETAPSADAMICTLAGSLEWALYHPDEPAFPVEVVRDFQASGTPHYGALTRDHTVKALTHLADAIVANSERHAD